MTYTIRHRIGSAVRLSAMVAISTLAFHGVSRAQDWKSIEDAAKQEGNLVVYTGSPTPSYKAIGALFEQRYGIKTTVQYLLPPELRERIRTESVASRAIGSIAMTGSTLRASPVELFQKHATLPNASKLIEPFKDDGMFAPVDVLPFGILINTNMVKPEDMPKSWMDLLDPKWKGKILLDDPRVPGGGNATLAVLEEKLGVEFLKKFVVQLPTFSTDLNVGQRRTAQGEFPLYVPFISGNIVRLEGLPVKGVIPVEGAPYNDTVMTLTAKAPHPNAAQLFLNFVLSDEGQIAISEDGRVSVTGQASPKLPENVRALAHAKLLGNADPLKLDENLRQRRELFK